MKCPKCGKQVLIEALGDGKKRLLCQSCGFNQITDDQGRRLLTEVPEVNKGRYLTETV